jgi:hypothetical protein
VPVPTQALAGGVATKHVKEGKKAFTTEATGVTTEGTEKGTRSLNHGGHGEHGEDSHQSPP